MAGRKDKGVINLLPQHKIDVVRDIIPAIRRRSECQHVRSQCRQRRQITPSRTFCSPGFFILKPTICANRFCIFDDANDKWFAQGDYDLRKPFLSPCANWVGLYHATARSKISLNRASNIFGFLRFMASASVDFATAVIPR